MKVGIRQGVCYDSPAEWTSSENGRRCSGGPIRGGWCVACQAVGGRVGWGEGRTRVGLDQPAVQILVGVAGIQGGALRTEEGKGSGGSGMRPG